MTPDQAHLGDRVFYTDLEGRRQPGTIVALSSLQYEARVAWDEDEDDDDEEEEAPSWQPVADLQLD